MRYTSELKIKIEKLRDFTKVILNQEKSKLSCDSRSHDRENIDYLEKLLKETEV